LAKSNSKRILIFGCLGLLAGLLTTFSGYIRFSPEGFAKQAWSLFIGVIFGIVFAVYAWRSGICRSIWRLLSFAIASSVAYAMAVLGGMSFLISPSVLTDIFGQELGPDLTVCLVGGVIGGAIVFTSFAFLVAPPSSWTKSAVKLLTFSVASGLLGMLAWGLGALIAKTGPGGDATSFFSLYVIWQVGAGILLAYLLPPVEAASQIVSAETKTDPGSTRQVVAVAATLALFGALAFLVQREVRGYQFGLRLRAKEAEALKRAVSEAPPMQNLPNIPSFPKREIVIDKPIHGYANSRSFVSQSNPQFSLGGKYPPVPPAAHYTAGYEVQGERSPYGNNTFADVDVTIYPSAEWAHYEMRNRPTPNSAFLDADHNLSVSKFGNRIVMNTSMWHDKVGGDLYFFWPSGQKLVFLRFFRGEDDEFLKEYLALHPSSL